MFYRHLLPEYCGSMAPRAHISIIMIVEKDQRSTTTFKRSSIHWSRCSMVCLVPRLIQDGIEDQQ